jgi:hypothetical protein
MKTDCVSEYIGFVRADKEALQTNRRAIIHSDQKVSLHLMIPVQKITQKYFNQFQSLT